MVDSDPGSDEDSEDFCANFSLQLIHHTVAVPKIGKQAAIKSKRDIHSKELAFVYLPTNYVAFM
jgi:hypothetical protein